MEVDDIFGSLVSYTYLTRDTTFSFRALTSKIRRNSKHKDHVRIVVNDTQNAITKLGAALSLAASGKSYTDDTDFHSMVQPSSRTAPGRLLLVIPI